MAEETGTSRKSSPPEETGTREARGAPVEVSRVKLLASPHLGLAAWATMCTIGFLFIPMLALFLDVTFTPDHDWSFFPWWLGIMVVSYLVGRWLLRWMVSIGADGILKESRWSQRFIPYAQIRAVQHMLPVRGFAAYCVQVEMTGGEILNLPTWGELGESQGGPRPALTNDPLGAELARAITAARDAWASGRTDQSLHEEVLARNGRSGAEWLAALRSLSAGAPDVYRAATMDAERLWRLLDQPGAPVASRVAAAVVLGASRDAPARRKLRVVARSMVDPGLKRVVERAAGARDDDALIEALEAIEGGAHEAVSRA